MKEVSLCLLFFLFSTLSFSQAIIEGSAKDYSTVRVHGIINIELKSDHGTLIGFRAGTGSINLKNDSTMSYHVKSTHGAELIYTTNSTTNNIEIKYKNQWFNIPTIETLANQFIEGITMESKTNNKTEYITIKFEKAITLINTMAVDIENTQEDIKTINLMPKSALYFAITK